jgi:sulfoxide reductase heme-binding subunit YedZ
MKHSLGLFTTYLLPALLFGAVAFIPDYAQSIYHYAGKSAEILLIAILFVKPIAILSGSPHISRLLPLRREFGIGIVWLALAHGLGYIAAIDLLGSWALIDPTKPFLPGVIALLFLLILGTTSNDTAVRVLRARWRTVQALAYPTLFLVLLHSSLMAGELPKFFILGGLYVFLRIFAWRKVHRSRTHEVPNTI